MAGSPMLRLLLLILLVPIILGTVWSFVRQWKD
jgi:hypothetical protein